MCELQWLKALIPTISQENHLNANQPGFHQTDKISQGNTSVSTWHSSYQSWSHWFHWFSLYSVEAQFQLTDIHLMKDISVVDIYNWPFPADAGAYSDYTWCFNIESEAFFARFWYWNTPYNHCLHPHWLEMVNYRYPLYFPTVRNQTRSQSRTVSLTLIGTLLL